jgi:hypothetical protein
VPVVEAPVQHLERCRCSLHCTHLEVHKALRGKKTTDNLQWQQSSDTNEQVLARSRLTRYLQEDAEGVFGLICLQNDRCTIHCNPALNA